MTFEFQAHLSDCLFSIPVSFSHITYPNPNFCASPNLLHLKSCPVLVAGSSILSAARTKDLDVTLILCFSQNTHSICRKSLSFELHPESTTKHSGPSTFISFGCCHGSGLELQSDMAAPCSKPPTGFHLTQEKAKLFRPVKASVPWPWSPLASPSALLSLSPS